MSSSASETQVRWVALVAATGTGAYAFPLTVPWHLLCLAVPSVAGIVVCHTRVRRSMWAALCIVVFAAVLKGHLPSPLAAAVVSASALAMAAAPAMGAAIVVMNVSLVMTTQEIIADTMHSAHLEAAGPALTAIVILLLARLGFVRHAVGTGALSIFAAWGADYMRLPPEVAMAVAALPACGLAALMVLHE